VANAVKAMIREGVRLDSAKVRDRIHDVVRSKGRRRGRAVAVGAAEVRGRALRLLATGAKQHDRVNKGGRTPKADRNRKMALEYLRRAKYAGDYTEDSATAVMVRIGYNYGLSERASVRAIVQGLADLGLGGRKPS
jgi:hypothetical protein